MTDTVRDHLTDLHLALCAADAAFKSMGQAAVKAIAVLPSNDRDIKAISDVAANPCSTSWTSGFGSGCSPRMRRPGVA
ncbi:MAG: hypothetical protein RKP20_09530 [Candidatus Competibacter sp.]|nr:hypothetical protein [Candidatus Competibacter sp.]